MTPVASLTQLDFKISLHIIFASEDTLKAEFFCVKQEAQVAWPAFTTNKWNQTKIDTFQQY